MGAGRDRIAAVDALVCVHRWQHWEKAPARFGRAPAETYPRPRAKFSSRLKGPGCSTPWAGQRLGMTSFGACTRQTRIGRLMVAAVLSAPVSSKVDTPLEDLAPGVPMRERRRSVWLTTALPVTIYAVLGFAAYLPAWPGDPDRISQCTCSDPGLNAWFLAFTAHAIAHGQNLFFTTAINWPHGANLTYNAQMPLLGLLAAPLTLTAGPIASLNLLCGSPFRCRPHPCSSCCADGHHGGLPPLPGGCSTASLPTWSDSPVPTCISSSSPFPL